MIAKELSEIELELKNKLQRLSGIFDLNNVSKKHFSEKDVIKYYVDSSLGYSKVHSEHGSIHMALNADGVFNKDGYYEQAKIIAEYINKDKNKHIIEIACGKGFNTDYLAMNFPELRFSGIDLTPKHIKFAKSKIRPFQKNVDFKVANFLNLPFPNETFDFAFEVESVCHATDMQKALGEINRVLLPNSLFLVFDGFRKPIINELHEDFRLASRLVEVSMAIDKAWILDEWIKIAENSGFELIKIQDYSNSILPNLKRFERYAEKFLNHPIKRRIISFFLPQYLIKNVIAAFLMPTLIKAGVHSYSFVVLKKK